MELVGHVQEHPLEFILASHVRPGDILFVACEGCPLREGSIRARDAWGYAPRIAIPTIAANDLIYRAIAIGEDAFK